SGGGWGQSLPDDGPSPYGPPRPEAEGRSPSAGSLAPREVGGVTLSRDESCAPAAEDSTEQPMQTDMRTSEIPLLGQLLVAAVDPAGQLVGLEPLACRAVARGRRGDLVELVERCAGRAVPLLGQRPHLVAAVSEPPCIRAHVGVGGHLDLDPVDERLPGG